MSEAQAVIMREFLAWVAAQRRTYKETIEAWRSHCPRQTVWEDAILGKLVQVTGNGGRDPEVRLTAQGKSLLNQVEDPGISSGGT